MIYLPEKASKRRLREAENARRNRAEIVAARSQGQATRRDLFKWGAITAGGLLVCKNGLSPFARSAYAGVPTGTPRSPLFGAQPFTTPMLRFNCLTPIPLASVPDPTHPGVPAVAPAAGLTGEAGALAAQWGLPATIEARTEVGTHTVKVRSDPRGPAPASSSASACSGPFDGRPPGAYFAHQRWEEYLPKVGFLVSTGQIAPETRYHPNFAAQLPNSVWTFGEGRFVNGTLPPSLIKARYGEPVLLRHYNNLPFELENNGGFGRQEPSTHNHNAHNGAESDGAQNSFFFPGQFYDYHWSTTLARADAGLIDSCKRDVDALRGIKRGDPRASGPTDDGDIVLVPGDFRELQGTLWFHDHRFFFTAENVYKGFAAMLNYYSGPDRGYERSAGLTHQAASVNLQLPSGFLNGKTWGNKDFDVNLLIQDVAFDPDGQLFFDIFDTDGFLGDVMHVNFQYKPFFEVLPRKYRFRVLSAGMSRWIDLAWATSKDANAKAIPVLVVGNDGNLFPEGPIKVASLGKQGTAERFDVIVDFSKFEFGQRLYLVNLLQFSNGRRPDGILTLSDALSGKSPDPAVGAILEFRIVSQVQSVDDSTKTLVVSVTGPNQVPVTGANDQSQVPSKLSEQIPIVTPCRTRTIQFDRDGHADAGRAFNNAPPATDDPWAISVTTDWGTGSDHHLDARRSSNLPCPGDIEHWTFKNGGGGWDHPIHLHFEEAVTMNRGSDPIPVTELLKRKDVWRLNPSGQVQFQVMFGEYGGAYVNHCHNTVHEDHAMLLRYDLLRSGTGGVPVVHTVVLPTPDPRPCGVTYVQSCSLPEGNPKHVPTGVPNCPPWALGSSTPVPAIPW